MRKLHDYAAADHVKRYWQCARRMSKKTPVEKKPLRAFRPDPAIGKAMLRLQARDGISISEQIRRAMREWLPKQGVLKKERKSKRTAERSRP